MRVGEEFPNIDDYNFPLRSFMVRSVGPNQIQDGWLCDFYGNHFDEFHIYHTSNGLISVGDIYRRGGEYFPMWIYIEDQGGETTLIPM